MTIVNESGSLLTCLYSNQGSRVYNLDSNSKISELGWNNGWYVSGELAASATIGITVND